MMKLTKKALRDFMTWRSSRGGMSKSYAVEEAYQALVHRVEEPFILTTATHTEGLNVGYEDYLIHGKEGYVALGWGPTPQEFHEQKRVQFDVVL